MSNRSEFPGSSGEPVKGATVFPPKSLSEARSEVIGGQG